MLGIVIKDYYETFCLKKNIIGMIFSLSVILLVVALIDNLYAFVLIVGITLPMMGASTLQSSMEQDEISKFDQILLTFPITRQEIVKAKLLSSLLLTLITNLLLSLLITIVYVFIYQTVDLKTGLLVLFIGFIIALIMNAINGVGFFLLGNKKGAVVYTVLVAVFAFGYVMFNLNFDLSKLLSLDIGVILILSLIAAIVLNIISYFICVKIYNRKHS